MMNASGFGSDASHPIMQMTVAIQITSHWILFGYHIWLRETAILTRDSGARTPRNGWLKMLQNNVTP